MKKQFTLFSFKHLFLMLGLLAMVDTSWSQSVARQWSDVQLSCIRKDRPRPTVQARNLAHASIVMWDAFAAFDPNSEPVLLGSIWGGFSVPFNGITTPEDLMAAQNEAISYAMYRLLWQRYLTTPLTVPNTFGQVAFVTAQINGLMTTLGYDPNITSTDFSDGDPAKLGNYIAAQMQLYALQDGANQNGGGAGYANQYYTPVHGPLTPEEYGNPNCLDANRWQALNLNGCFQGTGPGFDVPCVPNTGVSAALSPEFGNVNPFSLTPTQKTVHQRDGHDWNVYLDPGAPPYLDLENPTGMESIYKWGYVLNSVWHSMHTTEDGMMQDISPATIGNVLEYPTQFSEYPAFYDMFNGGDPGLGYDINPATNLPYNEQIVPRGDYTRALSEYWADGPASETPPGHWFKLLNDVNSHPLQENKWNGVGEIIPELEWDVRCYLTMGGALMDAAIACWSAKGYYDYTRPIYAIRAMCDFGQCSDDELPNYHVAGIPLIPGYIELITADDTLSGNDDEFVDEIKVYTWLGPELKTGENGVGWKRGSEWWTYQAATFVTPPFPGYYSGHSTYSRSGAEVMTLITGDEYFPGGMGEYVINAGSLAADEGPSMEVRLQWAKYRDASDQCSLSRIYGGLHPPQDDIPGRMAGSIVGPQAFAYAEAFMNAGNPHASIIILDNWITDADTDADYVVTINFTEAMDQTIAPIVDFNFFDNPTTNTLSLPVGVWSMDGMSYTINYDVEDMEEELDNVRWHVTGAKDLQGKLMLPTLSAVVHIDTRNPMVNNFMATDNSFNVASVGMEQLDISFTFDEAMDVNVMPTFTYSEAALGTSISFASGSWSMDAMSYNAIFDIMDNDDEYADVNVMINTATDAVGNVQIMSDNADVFSIDTKQPTAAIVADDNSLNQADATSSALILTFTYDEIMDINSTPTITFPNDDVTSAGLTMQGTGMWDVDMMTYTATFNLDDVDAEMFDIDIATISALDLFGNSQIETPNMDVIDIDTRQPLVAIWMVEDDLISDINTQGAGTWTATFIFDEMMDTSVEPVVSFPGQNPVGTLQFSDGNWGFDAMTYMAVYTVLDGNIEMSDIEIAIDGAIDNMGNGQIADSDMDSFSIDTRNPLATLLLANDVDISDDNVGDSMFHLHVFFDEEMDMDIAPTITFPNENPSSVVVIDGSSTWTNSTTYLAKFDVLNGIDMTLLDIDVRATVASDEAGNAQVVANFVDFFNINVTIGVVELGNMEVLVYPNPVASGNDLIVAMSQIPADLVLQMFDVNGALIASKTKANQEGNQLHVDTQNLAAGMYFINLTSGLGTASLKVQVGK